MKEEKERGWKAWVRAWLAARGYALRRIRPIAPGSDTRPIGDLPSFLEDIHARGFPIRWAVDCGANAGEWSQALLRAYPEAQVVMVEAQESMRPGLEALARRFPAARVHIGGVGRRSERRLFTYWPDRKGSTFLAQEDKAAQADGRQAEISIDPLPDILAKFGAPPPDLVKMDIQGFELEALQGMEALLPQVGALVLESNLFSFLPGQPQAEVLIGWLAARGFHLYDVCGYGRRPSDGALSHLDFVFANDAGYLRRYRGW